MDPRRARDPRLARADPRLQRQPNTPPVQADPSRSYPNPNNSAPPLQNFAPSWPEQDAKPALSEPPPSDGAYKARPLFCVVCASNNVSFSYMLLLAYAHGTPEQIHGGP
jgi:RNA polymerase II subunit A C-terminal domain phosphatase SSU72